MTHLKLSVWEWIKFKWDVWQVRRFAKRLKQLARDDRS